MRKFIEAMEIFSKYTDGDFFFGCEHDELYVFVSPDDVSEDDKSKLDELGFFTDREYDCFKMYA